MRLTKYKFLLLSIFSFFMLESNLYSQEKKQDSIKSVELDEVVITGSKKYRQAGNVTQKIDVVPLKEMEMAVTGQGNLAELTARKPGTSVAALAVNYPNWGTNAGLGMKYSTYMLDGLPVDAMFEPMALDAKAISRIEVQRGPASVLYPNFLSQEYGGSQSSLGGTINLILKKRIEKRETSALVSYGSFNTLNTQLYHQDKKGENLNYFAGVNYENSDYTNYGIDGSWLDMKKSPEYNKLKMYAGVNLFYGENKKNRLSLFANNTRLKGDEGRIYRAYLFDLTTLNFSQMIELSDVLHFNASAGLRSQEKKQQGDSKDKVSKEYKLAQYGGYIQNIIPVDMNITFKHGGNNLLTAGVDYQNVQFLSEKQKYKDNIAGAYDKITKTRHHQFGFYAQEEMKISDFTLRGGLRYNVYNSRVDLINSEKPGVEKVGFNKLLWSAGAKYNSSLLTVYSNVGNSFRAPGIKELAGNIKEGDTQNPGQLPSPDLKPETGIGVDLGVDIKPTAGLKLGLRGYYINIENFASIVNVRNSPSQTKAVAGDGNLISKGVEFEINHKISPNFSWFANYTYFDAKKDNGKRDTFTPDNIVNAGLFYLSESGLKINPMINYTGKYYDGLKHFKPGALVNIFVSQRLFKKENTDLDVFLKAYNLTDNKFELPWQFQNTGLAITGGFVINLK